MAHITDLHLDLDYKEGSVSNCNNSFLCCRSDSYGKGPDIPAGYWGQNGQCDIPLHTLEA